LQAADLVRKILSERGLSQGALADLLGIDASLPSHYLSGKREPGPIPSLLLASLATEQQERAFWIEKSGLDGKKLTLIAEALSLPSPTTISSEEEALLNWWRHPKGPVEKSLKDFVEQLLTMRTL
jgi:transcriptional regulator with XRE-family HTH domain